jgi:D-amino-acid oxidase
MQRRDFLKGTSALAALSLTGCVPKNPLASTSAPALPFYDAVPPLTPIRAHEDRIFRITVCLRPFRAAGPRIDALKLNDKLIVTNYGHGGSGWSLSWGSSKIAVENAMLDGDKDIAIIGCGALGLTSAITAQRMGARVTIYAKERPPEVRSARATGSWTPDSRVALTSAAAPDFAATWERMARTSWSMYQSFLGAPGNPVEYMDTYNLSDNEPPAPGTRRTAVANSKELSSFANGGGPASPASAAAPPLHLDFARYADRIADLTPRGQDLPSSAHPFPTKFCRRNTTLVFNVADYARQLLADFLLAGGRIETADFHTPADFAALPQNTIVCCTGYGSRALWSDETITPVRGQIAWLIPQPNTQYAIYYKGLNMLARRDGIVLQTNPGGESSGWNDTNETADRTEAENAVHILQDLYTRMAAMPHHHA